MDNEIAVRESDKLMMMAIEKGSDLAQVEKLLELKMQYEADEARKEYHDSMVKVHSAMPSVFKGLDNKQTNSSYAALDEIILTTKKHYTDAGFSITFYEGSTDKSDHVRICADVIHRSGHKETYHYDVPLDGVGIKGNANMTKIHAKASSTTYGRRYLMCMIFNIPTSDDDGNSATPVEYITKEQANEILDKITEKGIDLSKFLAYMKADEVFEIPATKYKTAIMAINSAKGKTA